MPSLPQYSPGTPNFTGYTNADFNIVPRNLMEELQAQEKAAREAQIQEAQAAKAKRQMEAEQAIATQLKENPNFDVNKIPDLLMQSGAQTGDINSIYQGAQLKNLQADNERQQKQQAYATAQKIAETTGDVNAANAVLIAAGLPVQDFSRVGVETRVGQNGEIIEIDRLGRVKVLRGQQPSIDAPKPRPPRQYQDEFGNWYLGDAITGEKIPSLEGKLLRAPKKKSATEEFNSDAPRKTEGRAPAKQKIIDVVPVR